MRAELTSEHTRGRQLEALREGARADACDDLIEDLAMDRCLSLWIDLEAYRRLAQLAPPISKTLVQSLAKSTGNRAIVPMPIVPIRSINLGQSSRQGLPELVRRHFRRALALLFGLLAQRHDALVHRRLHLVRLCDTDDLAVQPVDLGWSTPLKVFPHRGARVGIDLDLHPRNELQERRRQREHEGK